MPLYKITQSFNNSDPSQLYFGCTHEEREDGIYADVPDYAVEAYIKSGRVLRVVSEAKMAPKISEAPKAPKVEKTKEPSIPKSKEPETPKVEDPKDDLEDIMSAFNLDDSAEDVVAGQTEKSEEKKRVRRTKAQMAEDNAKKAK